MAAEGDPCDCRYCPPDPNLTCSYTGDDVSVLWNYVSNACRGDLLLCPGGDNGQIGGVLHQLDPPQHYSAGSSARHRVNANTARQPRGNGEITLRRRVKEALRMRPNRIIVGEVRQEECLDLSKCALFASSSTPGV